MTVQPTKKGEWRHLSEQAAIGLIENLAANDDFPRGVVDRGRAEHDECVQQLKLCAESEDDPSGEITTPQYQRLQHEALRIQRQTFIRLQTNT
jgi:hypothetical protein